MIKQLVLPLAGVAVFLILVGLLVKNSGNIVIPGITTPAPSPAVKTITLGEKSINVEVADTESERSLGLGKRESLGENTGMLFVFEDKDVLRTFWMKDMAIPLDIIWINDDKVVKIDKNVPAPPANTSDENLTQYKAPSPIDYVLEVNAGFSDKNDTKAGDTVDLIKI